MPAEKLSKAGANISTTIPVGTITSYAIASLILSLSNWRLVFIVDGAILLLGGLIWFFGMAGLRDYIKHFDNMAKPQPSPNAPLQKNPLTGLKFFPLLFKAGLLFAVAAVFFNGVLKDGVTIWVPAFLSDFFGVSPGFSAALSMVMPLVSLGGAYAAIHVNEKYIKNEMATGGIFFTVGSLAILLLYLIGRLNIFVAILMIALSLSSMLAVNSMLLTFIPFHFKKMGKAASITGFLNACSYFSSAVSSVTIGLIAEKSGWSVTILSWLLVAGLGALVSFAGRSAWAKGRSFAASGS
jgi:OPA family glycerol-3-phosphate transporter-like MFS transporter